ncbi:hypothetical protein [Neobacillus sp. CF12]|uniref:hypothetical protein n=1 Tax=Neobacillus sp. CF12 TaxID=3055864 RepID=UPI00259FEFB8|nr:hypothetical protein [Neobacillus sp. CF12]MDM5326794.1 hypothetical protein [Neobacillus sp. CF12]
MTVKVETYYHPQKWEEHEIFPHIKNEIHICATRNLVDGIKERYRIDETGDFQYIFTIRQVINHIFKKWYKPERLLEQYLSISRITNSLPGDENLKAAFRKNTSELLETIRFLVFSGVHPESLKTVPNLTNKERFFGNLWYKLEKQDSDYDKLRGLLRGAWKQENIHDNFNAILEGRYEKGEDVFLEIPKSTQKIVLHGFYFITPEQQVFLKLLERAGYELLFFQFYDERFPNTFDFSKMFISHYFGWTDQWNIQKRDKAKETIASRFLQSFEEGTQEKWSEEKKVFAYESFFDFLHNVVMEHYPIGEQKKHQDEDVQIIATNADILNDMLVQYYPERFANRRNFLHYPVGQFIVKLHDMRQQNRLILNEEILMISFSSGWLTDKRTMENAQFYTLELEQILPFFSDCVDIESWIQRMEDLLTQYDTILPLFENDEVNRVLESIRSPFSKIGHLSLDRDRVKQIYDFFLLLKEMAGNLFDLSQEESSINEHFKRLSKLMMEYNPVTNKVLLQQEEAELIEKINRKIASIEDTHQFLYEDIGNAIQFYLSGKFSDDEDVFIKPFIEVDGEAFKTKSRKIYLTGLDEQGLPLSEFSIPWPLQAETFSVLARDHKELELNELRNNSVKAISRYLLFMTLEFLWKDNLELSWICNFLDRENLEPAVYVQYLNMNVENHRLEMKKADDVPFNEFDFTTYQPDNHALQDAYEELKFEDILAEYELCPRRFYYGYVLDRYPVFSDKFIYQFIYSEIIRVVKRYTKQNDDAVIEMVSELFPQWSIYQKENMATTTLGYRVSSRDKREKIVGNVSVSQTRKNFQFPGLTTNRRSEIYDAVNSNKEQIMGEIQEPSPDFATMMEAKPDHHCRYCPYLDLCPDGNYSVDKDETKK